MTHHPHGGIGSNQYQTRGHSVSEGHPGLPHPDLMAQAESDTEAHQAGDTKLPGRWRLRDRFRSWLAQNYWFNPSAADSDRKMGALLAKSHNLWWLDHEAHRSDRSYILITLAEHPDLPTAAVQHLANDENELVRRTIAARSGLPLATARQLAQDQRWPVRAAIAEYSELPEALVDIVRNDPDPAIRQHALQNPHLPAHIKALASEL